MHVDLELTIGTLSLPFHPTAKSLYSVGSDSRDETQISPFGGRSFKLKLHKAWTQKGVEN